MSIRGVMRGTVILLMLFLLAGCSHVAPQPKKEPVLEVPQVSIPDEGSKDLSQEHIDSQNIEKIAQDSTTQVVTVAPKQKRPKTKAKPPLKKAKKVETGVDPNAKIVIGSVESVRVLPGDVVIASRVDTGAKSSSLDAVDLKLFERDGREFVRFKLGRNRDAPMIEKPVWKYVKIKRHGTTSQRRPVVKLRLTLGEIDQVVMVTLADRSQYQYPLLIGRNFIKDHYIVDVTKKNTSKPKVYKK